MLYELFEQRTLFRGVLIEIAMQHMQQAPPAMVRVGADVERLVHAMLAKDPAARPRSMADVIQQLMALDLPFTEHDTTRRAERPERPSATPAPTERFHRRSRPGSPLWWVRWSFSGSRSHTKRVDVARDRDVL